MHAKIHHDFLNTYSARHDLFTLAIMIFMGGGGDAKLFSQFFSFLNTKIMQVP